MASTESTSDLFAAPQHIHANFHCRVGKPPQESVPENLPVRDVAKEKEEAPRHVDLRTMAYMSNLAPEPGKAVHPENPDGVIIIKPIGEFGYPHPGVQSPQPGPVLTSDFFVSDTTWINRKNFDDCDYIVVGSGCTALAFIEEALSLDPKKKILCLERGGFLLPSHFQNLPLPFKMVLGGDSETFPFTLSGKTFHNPELKFCHGSCPFFGGRSTFWSAWCPQPTPELMRDYPESMHATAREPDFWPKAHEILNVTSAADIDDTVFGHLQDMINKKLHNISTHVPSADISEPAKLAVGRRSPTTTLRFNKFSTPGPLLARYDTQRELALKKEGAPLEIRLNCTVQDLKYCKEDGYIRGIATQDRMLQWKTKKPKVILCAGAFPNATLLLNAIPSAKHTVGKRLTGHFLTHIAARVPISAFGPWDDKLGLEIAAQYVAGKHPETGRQYHVQITAIHSPNPRSDAEDLARECPDYAAAATYDQLNGSEKHIVFVCASLGEFTENNSDSWLRPDPENKDVTTNVKLQYTLAPDDKKLWDLMDTATYETIAAMSGDASKLEFWDEGTHGWTEHRPAKENIRVPGIVHEASVSYVGPEEEGGSLDGLYRPHGVKNLFVTGAGILPTAGSWNPTMTICGYAQDLARRLHRGEGDS